MVDYLLDLGAPAAVYDIHGNCVVSLMVDKMPELAYKALNQFMTVEKASRKVYYYLCNLDFDVSCKLGRTPARPILEVTVTTRFTLAGYKLQACFKPLGYKCYFLLEMPTEHVQKLSARPEKIRVACVARDRFSNKMLHATMSRVTFLGDMLLACHAHV